MERSEAAAVVCDAGPLIHLDELRSLTLFKMFSAVYVPGTVWHEVRHHRPAALRHRYLSLIRVDNIAIVNSRISTVIDFFPLDPGE